VEFWRREERRGSFRETRARAKSGRGRPRSPGAADVEGSAAAAAVAPVSSLCTVRRGGPPGWRAPLLRDPGAPAIREPARDLRRAAAMGDRRAGSQGGRDPLVVVVVVAQPNRREQASAGPRGAERAPLRHARLRTRRLCAIFPSRDRDAEWGEVWRRASERRGEAGALCPSLSIHPNGRCAVQRSTNRAPWRRSACGRAGVEARRRAHGLLPRGDSAKHTRAAGEERVRPRKSTHTHARARCTVWGEEGQGA
jgi:hypothetical protein